jgi:hypothetical protein
MSPTFQHPFNTPYTQQRSNTELKRMLRELEGNHVGVGQMTIPPS